MNTYIFKTKKAEYHVNLLFDELKEGLTEAISNEKGSQEVKVKTYTILPVKKYTSKEIFT